MGRVGGEGPHRAAPSVRGKQGVGAEKRKHSLTQGVALLGPGSRSLAGLSGSGVFGSRSATCVTSPRQRAELPRPADGCGPGGLATDAEFLLQRLLRTCARRRSRVLSPPVPWLLVGSPGDAGADRVPLGESGLCGHRVPQSGADTRSRLRRREDRDCSGVHRAAFGIPAPRPFPSTPLAGSFSSYSFWWPRAGWERPSLGHLSYSFGAVAETFFRGEKRGRRERGQCAQRERRPAETSPSPYPFCTKHLGGHK